MRTITNPAVSRRSRPTPTGWARRGLCGIALALMGPALTAEDLEITLQRGGEVSLAGTLSFATGIGTTPRGPAVLIVPGSGPTDRDGNQGPMANNSLKLVAEAFATAGISSLRIDKRGIGASSKVAEDQMVFELYVDDAAAWLAELRRRGFSPVIALGHSEGSLVTGLAAARGGADGWISLCGAGEPIGQILRRQLATAGLPPFLLGESESILEKLERGEKVEKPNPLLWNLFRPSVQPYLISWLALDPAQTAAALKVPILAIAGETDLQIPPADAQRLLRLRPDLALILIPGMNHVLKVAPAERQANLAAYNQPELPLAPGLAKALTDFVHRVVASIPPAPPQAPEVG